MGLYNGRRDQIRTDDPYVPNVVLYQAEPPSDNANIISKPWKNARIISQKIPIHTVWGLLRGNFYALIIPLAKA